MIVDETISVTLSRDGAQQIVDLLAAQQVSIGHPDAVKAVTIAVVSLAALVDALTKESQP